MTFHFYVINIDGCGEVRTCASVDVFLATEQNNVLGPEGSDRVRLNPAWMAAGWVNDCGLLPSTNLPRNVVGGVALATLGAAQQPYAGPVVLTGWDARATLCGQIEVESLSVAMRDIVQMLVSDIRTVLDMQPGNPTNDDPQWARDVHTFADYVANGPVSLPRVVHGEEALDALLGRLR